LIAANLAEQILAEAVVKRDAGEGGFSGLKSLFLSLETDWGCKS